MAGGHFRGAVSYLNTEFDRLDADRWIEAFGVITSAPRRNDAVDVHTAHAALTGQLLAEVPELADLPDTDPHGERWLTVAGMVVARWLWCDPLTDPTLRMNPMICNGFRDLARRSPRGGLRLVAEADFYDQDGRP